MKNKRLITILKAVGSFLIVLGLCASAALFFHSYYYEAVYISGGSMSPTLNGADENALVNADDKGSGVIADFGIMDTHQSAKNHIKRFDIISTYYASDYNAGIVKSGATKKIKRVIGLPNETIKIEDGSLYVLNNNQYELVSYPFKTNPAVETKYTGKDVEIELSENEYWVLGDNRQASNDSSSAGPVKSEYILGVLVAIEGKGEVYVKGYVCQNCGKFYKYSDTIGGSCMSCHVGMLSRSYDIKSKQYHWPKYF